VPLRWSSRHGAPPGTTGSTIDDPSWSLTSPPFFFSDQPRPAPDCRFRRNQLVLDEASMPQSSPTRFAFVTLSPTARTSRLLEETP
jgi:hypothetical protein